jgi:mannose-6-phosphate isomerase-like protein (cupin superfamily)
MEIQSAGEYKKVWGAEYWIVNRDYCGKRLVLKKGYECSLHCHKEKDETFYILSGRVLFRLEHEVKVLIPGNIVLIKPLERHQFIGLEGSEIIEFSTHHKEEDSYRYSKSQKIPDDEFKKLLEEWECQF